MKSNAAIAHESGGKWEVVELDVDAPRDGELLIRMAASGMCHSDDHIITGDMPFSIYPVAGGHEGAGVVESVGPDTEGWAVGDHVVLSFVPFCGRCRWCASGMQNLCDSGAGTMSGARADGSFRMTLDGVPVGQMAGISTFSAYSTVSVRSAVKIPSDLDLEVACLVGCGVNTGWGSAVNSAEVHPGDVVIVMGVGGIGINAVQGAADAGARVVIAVDPVEFKRTTARSLGATHTAADMAEATELARSFTNGQGADSCIVCVGVTTGAHVAEGVEAIRKGGICVATGIGKIAEVGIPVSPSQLTLYQKRIQGSLYGECSPSRDILRLLDLYGAGRLHLDELITRRYSLAQINEGYADMHGGTNIRGVIVHQH